MEHFPMRKGSVLALLTAGTALSLGLAVAPAALAAAAPAPVPASNSGPGGGGGGSGRPGGQPVTNDGFGSLGTAWHLKSMHDDLAGAQVVGEEFEIDAPDPQNWTITLADNGTTFPFTETIGVGSLTVNGMTANQAGTQHMTASAKDTVTGEVITPDKAFVDLPPLGS
jgi:hypothetical protein